MIKQSVYEAATNLQKYELLQWRQVNRTTLQLGEKVSCVDQNLKLLRSQTNQKTNDWNDFNFELEELSKFNKRLERCTLLFKNVLKKANYLENIFQEIEKDDYLLQTKQKKKKSKQNIKLIKSENKLGQPKRNKNKIESTTNKTTNPKKKKKKKEVSRRKKKKTENQSLLKQQKKQRPTKKEERNTDQNLKKKEKKKQISGKESEKKSSKKNDKKKKLQEIEDLQKKIEMLKQTLKNSSDDEEIEEVVKNEENQAKEKDEDK
ncbi:hypothetical protein M0812_28147 [Anaeramoeba flamelloides]|uniref:Uncharacterized protein n=1 Tax=Anaeramoeba flamelloides TaxID=1746091 RepID=A0AAV7YCS1_9EUKA|nr:hypothetical protein M0812_28147 [Anaeramoeba flamelloides]